jgi:uncharacterized membrane protein
MSVIVWAFLIGIVAGLRALTPLAAVSWAAHLGRLPVAGAWLGFLGFTATPYVATLLAIAELVGDSCRKPRAAKPRCRLSSASSAAGCAARRSAPSGNP